MRSRPDRSRIRDEWIQHTIDHPVQESIQTDGRVRRWAFVDQEERYLRIVLLADRETVHNAFFDRNFKPRSST